MTASICRVFVFFLAAACLAEESPSANLCGESECDHEFVTTELGHINAADVSVELLQRSTSEVIDEDDELDEDAEEDASPCKQSCQKKYEKFVKKGKESMGKEKVCKKKKCSGCDMCADEAEAAPAPAPEKSPTFSKVQDDRYWECDRKGMGNQHGFGHGTVQECFAATLKDPACKGQFDYNQGYNGQCKCVTAEGCTALRGIRGYVAYKYGDADGELFQRFASEDIIDEDMGEDEDDELDEDAEEEDASPCKQSCQKKYEKFVKKGKESMGKEKVCKKKKCSGCDMCADEAEAAPAPAPEKSPTFSKVQDDRYWECDRKGMGNQHGFGHGTVQECFAATLKDPACKGQFDYNQGYNGQCKCVTAEGCTALRGIRGYVAYKYDDA